MRRGGYAALRDPRDDDGILAPAFRTLKDVLRRTLADKHVVPSIGGGKREFHAAGEVWRLPGQFRESFGKMPAWRPEILFGRNLLNEQELGSSGQAFANWLGWGAELTQQDLNWPADLVKWWSALTPAQGTVDKVQTDALFALWAAMAEREWHRQPVVPNAAGNWIPAAEITWLNENPPSASEDHGAAVAEVMQAVLPTTAQTVLPAIHRQVGQQQSDAGVAWFKKQRKEVVLAALVNRAFKKSIGAAAPLVDLLYWAIGRGGYRQDLVPLVKTEAGPRKPEEALLADPLVPDAKYRRLLYSNLSPLSGEYGVLDKKALAFMERLGVKGAGELVEVKAWKDRGLSKANAARRLGVEVDAMEAANPSGYSIVDFALPFSCQKGDDFCNAVEAWLTAEHRGLERKGRLSANSKYNRPRHTYGTKSATWVSEIEATPWVRCTDQIRRRPGDVLLKPDLNFDDVPVAVMSSALAERLQQEGVKFGARLLQSPALRQLERRGQGELKDKELAELLRAAREQVDNDPGLAEQFSNILAKIRFRGTHTRDRLVRTVGAPKRGDLNGFVLAVNPLDAKLVVEIDELRLGLVTSPAKSHNDAIPLRVA